jgi:hypothetical protein
MLASNWAWALFDCAVTAHMRGDDGLALSCARVLSSIQGGIEAEAERRGFKLPDAYDGGKRRYLTFLQPLPSLLADQERRAKAGKRGPRLSASDIARYTDRAARIAALIEELDEVAARQWGQPGGVDVGEDQIVKELVAQGEEAVEPLLRVLESDERLTRSVSFHRDFFHQRHLITVAETAYSALTRILKTTSFVTAADNITEGAEGRRKLAGLIRAYLEKYGRGAIEERWYGVLLDDKAGTEAWVQAASNIVYLTTHEGTPPNWAFTSAPVPSQRSANGIILRGEPLRKLNSPSVSQLLTRRMLELSERKGEAPPYQSLNAATNFALALLAWDGQAQLSAVRSFQNLLKSRYDAMDAKDDNSRAYLRSMLVSLYLKRFEVNDPAAFNEYAEWIVEMKPEEAGESTAYIFTPMWRYANHPAMINVAARMFDSSGSPWLPLIDRESRQSFNTAKLLETPMLNVKSFRERVLEGLMDKTVVGTLRPRRTSAGDRYDMFVENTYTAVLIGGNNSPSASFEAPADDARAQRTLEPMNIRACDVYASRLVRLKGAPRFHVYWTEAERDRAVAEFITFIREHAGRFESSY